MSRASIVGVCLGVLVGVTAPLDAQVVDVGDPARAYARLLEIAGIARGPSLVRPWSVRDLRASLARPGHPWTRTGPSYGPGAPARLEWSGGVASFANTSDPRVANDGAVWQGKGITTALDGRVDLAWRGLSATVHPTLIYTQNADFELAVGPTSGLPFAYPWRLIDLPQRFGPDPFWTFDLGQTEVAARHGAVRGSFGTGSMWWGPGVRNAILMGNNAPGFAHGSFESARPLEVGIGVLEWQWIWGRLTESAWFGDRAADDRRFITGIAASFAPDFVDGLTLGGGRVFQRLVNDGVDFGEYMVVFQELFKSSFVSESSPEGNDARDQLLSLFARWTFPESGFEVYTEWARTDHSLNVRDLVLEPEHSQGYTLGLRKVFGVSARRIAAFGAELTRLESSPTFQIRPRPTYYEHSVVTQGYTHRGQVIGAGIGPGGNAQSLAVDVFAPSGSAGLLLERRVVDNDAFWEWAERTGGSFDRHNVTLNLGAHGTRFVDRWAFAGSATLTREFNRYFYDRDGWNMNVTISARYRPR